VSSSTGIIGIFTVKHEILMSSHVKHNLIKHKNFFVLRRALLQQYNTGAVVEERKTQHW